MSTPDAHTAYVLNEYDIDTALAFHMQARVFPQATYMIDAARDAIKLLYPNEEEPDPDDPEAMTCDDCETTDFQPAW